MKFLSASDFHIAAGTPLPNPRDMSIYDGKPYDCACGSSHTFESFRSHVNFGTNGVNAKMVVRCPDAPEYFTLIKTKYKFFVIFDRFVSLAGSKSESV